jgi:hypothetical protein
MPDVWEVPVHFELHVLAAVEWFVAGVVLFSSISLSSPRNYILVLLVVSISTSDLILFISIFCYCPFKKNLICF